MDIDKIKQSKITSKTTLSLIILIQLVYIIYNFTFVKQDYHPDEAWSFGLANSYYEPYIYQDADETRLTHSGYWFSSEELKNYLTVEPDHRFSYGSVFYNQSKDLHPPLYYLILHTICSCFPGRFSFWFGFVINIAVFIALQIYLYRLSKEVMKSDVMALITCAYFGFTSGALCIFVFVRMYALSTMFATISTFYHARLYNDNNLKRNLPIIFFVTLAGALTHHYYLVYAGALSACFCFYYLFKKKIKYLIVYSVTLLSSVGVSILIFPATINHLFGRRGVIQKLPLNWQAVMSLNCVFGELTGIQFKIGKTPAFTYLLCASLLIIIVLLPLSFLFRNEKWFNQLICHVKKETKKIIAKLKYEMIKINFYPLFLMVASVAVWIVVFNSVSMIIMDKCADRYLFVMYPSFCVTVICFCDFIFKCIIKNKKIAYFTNMCVCLIFAIFSNIFCPCIYLITLEDTVRNLYKGSDIVYITVSSNLLTQISKDVLNSRMIYMDSPENFVNEPFFFFDDDENTPVYLLIDEAFLLDDTEMSDGKIFDEWVQIATYSVNKNKWTKDEYESIILHKNSIRKCEYIGKDYISGYPTSVYRIR